MARIVFMNGTLVSENDAKVSVFDHGLLYGDGVFEGLRSYGGQVFRLDSHIDRLWESAKAICLEIPMSKKEVSSAVNATLEANQLVDGYVRLVVTRGAGSLGLDPNRTSHPQVIVIADTITLYPREFYDKGLSIITASTQRTHSAALSPRIKSLNYLNNIMAKLEGLRAGCVEALMLNHKGEVAECTGDNIFVVRSGTLVTPPSDAGILEGITRGAVIELAEAAKIDCQEKTLVRHDLYTADECFLTGTAAEVIPVVEIDSRSIGNGVPGPITKRLTADFHLMVRRVS
ncbi:MAG: branched-chain-amino-acid transaminase [Pirellulales bacterium]|jgi:branched-chain amino acid aminotransferase|nr:branched-chain-amino-acid transaminase [Planctomycetia bacterium]MDO7678035.1 branched-chain-amino-acid transaminase [Pirellulales bacterium]RLS28859.1 MAG: branched-chain-amino-acid transaminase [Planctomycetota bacterium]